MENNMSNRIRRKPAPENKPAPTPPPSVIPVPDDTFHASMARCYPNVRHYENRGASVPYEKTHTLEARYNKLWEGMTVPQYKGDFTEAAFIEKFGPLGQELHTKVVMLRGAALPGDATASASPALTAVHNILSALLFAGQITPDHLGELVSIFDNAENNRKPGENPRLMARKAVNAHFQKLNIPIAFHITQLEGVEAACMKRYFK